MGFGSMFFGDPERKRREKERVDLDNDYYRRAKAYNEAKTEERIRIAKQNGIRDAQPRKPFYKKVMGAGMMIGKDLVQGASKTNPNMLFNFDQPKQTRRRRRKKK
jgi:hypothetical protein